MLGLLIHIQIEYHGNGQKVEEEYSYGWALRPMLTKSFTVRFETKNGGGDWASSVTNINVDYPPVETTTYKHEQSF